MHHSRLTPFAVLLLAACSGGPSMSDAAPSDAESTMDGAPRDADPSDAALPDAARPCTSDEDCDDGLYCNGVESCADAGLCEAGERPDCDDSVECTIDTCSEALRECVSEAPDADGDGVADMACRGVDGLPLGDDCDDNDRDRFPGNTEVCDNADHDEDCDDTTYGAVDADRDGHDDEACCNVPVGAAPLCGTDCNDANEDVSPSDGEVCNGRDDDCDGRSDEGLATSQWFPDCDGDDFGDRAASAIVDCRVPTVTPGCVGGGGNWVTIGTDCNDGSVSVFPGATELCNGVDDDCGDGIDEGLTVFISYPDCDGDGFGDRDATPLTDCTAPGTNPSCGGEEGSWVATATDCDDTAVSVFPGATEVCNGVDDDCADGIDEGAPPRSWYPDCDEDSWGDRDATPVTLCSAPSDPPTCVGGAGAWAVRGQDCDESDASISPDANEVCNGVDDDCDDLADDIIPGTVICALGDSEACTNDCGTAGMRTCASTCLGFDACDSFNTEVCNYCDDDRDGLSDDGALAVFSGTTISSSEGRFRCDQVLGDATCGSPPMTLPPVAYEAVLTDGSIPNQAGAVWLSPSDWVTGYGPTNIAVQMQARTRPENGSADVEQALGGWAIVVMTEGTPGVGAPEDLGVQSAAITGLTAEWHWTTLTETTAGTACQTGTAPSLQATDSLRVASHPGSLPIRPTGATDDRWFCNVGNVSFSDSINNAVHLDEQTALVTQRMRIRYLQDDPGTVPNEETIELYVGNNGSDTLVQTWTAAELFPEGPHGELARGSRLRIGITAGAWTAEDPVWFPGSVDYGVPVETRVRLYRQNLGSPFTYNQQRAWMTVNGVCEAPVR